MGLSNLLFVPTVCFFCPLPVSFTLMWDRGGGQAAETPGPAQAGVCEDATETGRHREALCCSCCSGLWPGILQPCSCRHLHKPSAGHRGRTLSARTVQVRITFGTMGMSFVRDFSNLAVLQMLLYSCVSALACVVGYSPPMLLHCWNWWAQKTQWKPVLSCFECCWVFWATYWENFLNVQFQIFSVC